MEQLKSAVRLIYNLGRYIYDQKDYIQASAYYDSASNHANRELAASGALEMRRQNLAQLSDTLKQLKHLQSTGIDALSEEELMAAVHRRRDHTPRKVARNA